METLKLQKEIIKIIGELGWSRKRLAREVYTATYDDDPAEITKYEEKLKKDLTRKTTNPDRLCKYLQIISHNHEFEKADIVLPVYKQTNSLSEVMQVGMMDISKEIDEILVTEENINDIKIFIRINKVNKTYIHITKMPKDLYVA